MKALRHIRITRSAGKSIKLGLQYFIAKKKYYVKKLELDNSIVDRSEFL